MTKKYKFLKSISDTDKGTILFFKDDKYYYKNNTEHDRWLDKDIVESAGDLFEEVKDPERIEVTNLVGLKNSNCVEVYFSKNVDDFKDKFASIKKTIEDCLNEPTPKASHTPKEEASNSREYSNTGIISRSTHEHTELPIKKEPLLVPKDPESLKSYWSRKLSKSGCAFFLSLFDQYPNYTSREDVASDTGYNITSSNFGNTLTELRTLGLLQDGPDKTIRVHEDLFNN